MPLKHYQELIVWQKAMDFAEEVHALTHSFPRHEMFALTSQLRRAVISVPSNIAEGQARGGPREFVQFLNISSGSLQEVETQLILANRFGYVRSIDLQRILEKAGEIGRLTNGLIRSLKRKI